MQSGALPTSGTKQSLGEIGSVCAPRPPHASSAWSKVGIQPGGVPWGISGIHSTALPEEWARGLQKASPRSQGLAGGVTLQS